MEGRARVHDALEASLGGLDAGELADRLGLHHSTVRVHLRRLQEDGLVAEHHLEPQGRGRPRTVYTALAAPPDPYASLALVLAAALRTGVDVRAAGRAAGRRAAAQVPSGSAAVDVIADEARRLGFRPEIVADGSEVVLGACPYVVVAAQDPATICDLHHGLAEGLAEQVGGARVVDLVARDPRRAGCRIILEPEPADAADPTDAAGPTSAADPWPEGPGSGDVRP